MKPLANAEGLFYPELKKSAYVDILGNAAVYGTFANSLAMHLHNRNSQRTSINALGGIQT